MANTTASSVPLANAGAAKQASPRSILLTGMLSLVLAAIALVLYVLPAEYGLDPTGLGEKMGVKGMAGYSVSALTLESQQIVEDKVQFQLAPFESIEYKYVLNTGQSVVYEWQALATQLGTSDQGSAEVLFDFHSELKGSDPEDSVSFSIGRGSSERGTYVAPYEGIHGWFWENRGDVDVTVSLQATGFLSISKTYGPNGVYERDLRDH